MSAWLEDILAAIGLLMFIAGAFLIVSAAAHVLLHGWHW
jgi:hypothetical protein